LARGCWRAPIARRLTQTQFRTVAAPSYFAMRGRPRGPADLVQHNCLNFVLRETGLVRSWRFRRDGADLNLTPAGDMSFNDGGALFVAACEGYGVAQLQDYFADEAIAAGRLEPVLEKFKPAATPISAVYPATRHLSPKVRAFVDFLIAQFAH
jgi:DNA-binding transcriptional LysR family regulator